MNWHYFDNGKSVYFYYSEEKMPLFEIRRTRESSADDEMAIRDAVVRLGARPYIPATAAAPTAR